MIAYVQTERTDAFPTRVAYGEALVQLGHENDRVVVLDADLMGSTKTAAFAEIFPERFFQAGISEADMIGIAAGLAHEGFVPFASSFAIFLTGKTYDQIRQSICYSKNPVRLVATHAGLQPGPDGATHQGLEDIALMRALPGMTVVAPADSVETRKAVFALAEYDQPVYMRLGRSDWPILFANEAPFEIGKATIMKDGGDLTLIAYGQMVARALEAADQLSSEGLTARVLNMSTIEPLDTAKIKRAAIETGAIIVAEEHQLDGGLGESIARYLAETNPIPMGFIAMPNAFGESGTPDELMNRYELNVESIVQKAFQVHERKIQG